ncbi:MAG: hypothetical protein WAZ77_09640 [Candidatus Nitrosopolaris sp.]|jgi:hypothetical protein
MKPNGVAPYQLHVNIMYKTTTPIVFAIIILFCSTFMSSSIIYGPSHKAYADGLSEESLPPSPIGNRELSLFIKINPPVLTTASEKNAYVQFRLFDVANNKTIQHVTYEITVTKGTSSSKTQNPILIDFFHAHNGILTLHIVPTTGAITIYGKQNPILQAWVADARGNILVRGPLLLQGGLYHFHVGIFTIDNDAALVDLSNKLKFDSYVSVGSVYNKNESYQNHNYNTTLISYFNQIQNFKFDPSTATFSWSMPFDYNLTRIKQQPIFVHEELWLPKSWKGFGDLNRYNATVNGMPLSGSSLAIDPFSFPSANIIHYLVNKNDIIQLSTEYNTKHADNGGGVTARKSATNATALMNFALTPFTGTSQISTSSDIPTNTGSIHAAVSWSPNPLAPNTQLTLKLSFYDPTRTAPLTNTNVRYNLIIFDKNNQPVITKKNLLAKNAADTETIVFATKEIYHMELQITGLLKPGQTPDFTRNGVATGYVVVPEFPSSMIPIFLIAGLLGLLMVLQRTRLDGARVRL